MTTEMEMPAYRYCREVHALKVIAFRRGPDGNKIAVLGIEDIPRSEVPVTKDLERYVPLVGDYYVEDTYGAYFTSGDVFEEHFKRV